MELRASDSVTLPLVGIEIARDFSSFSIVFKDSDGTRLSTEVLNPLQYPRLDHEIANYKVALFMQEDWPESRILNIVFKKQRIGLLFSLQALASQETQLTANDRWNDCGFIALQKILLGEYEYGSQELNVPSTQLEPYQLIPQLITALYPDDTIVLVLDKSQCQKVMPDDLYESFFTICLPSLTLSGFFPQVRESQMRNSSGLLEFDDQAKELSLQAFSEQFPVEAAAFFCDVLVPLMHREQNPAFRLFLGYQVVEILMSNVYNSIVRDFAAKITTLPDIVSLKDLNDKLREKLSEKKRIELVIGSNLGKATADSSRDLLKECNALLTAINETPRESVGNALYKVRNYVVHSFSRVEAKNSHLEAIAWKLLVVLCNLAIEYRSADLSQIWSSPSDPDK